MAGAFTLRTLQLESPIPVPVMALDATLERHGKPMGNLDLMIAAHALAVEAILVTNDRAFRRLGKLKLEDWTK